jgi:MFS family permease
VTSEDVVAHRRLPGETGCGQRRADALQASERVAIYGVLLLASLAYNYNFILIDYIRPFLVRGLVMTLPDTALVYSAQAVGVMVGAFLTPVLVNRFGSRVSLQWAAGGLAVLTGANTVGGGFFAWITIRLVAGICLSGCYVSITTLLANIFPPHLRARLIAFNMAMFSVALLTAGVLGAVAGDHGWRWLIVLGAVAPAGVAILSSRALPDDRHLIVYGSEERAGRTLEKGQWREMVAGRRWRLTFACLLLAGLNFSAYQFYSGFITTYLMQVRHFGASTTALFIIIDGVGTLAGSLAFGWLADRFGRRINAFGFVLAAVFTAAVLIAPTEPLLLSVLEFFYAACLSCANIWAAYFAELFPVRLRPMGASLFHGGHVISILAPVVVTFVASHASLGLGMTLAPAAFLLGAVIWASLPETLRGSVLYRGFDLESIH